MKTGSVILCWILRVGLAAVYFWAGFAKLKDPLAFADGIEAFHFFPVSSVNILAMCTPILEIVAGILLLTPRWWCQGALLSCLLTVGFTLLFAWAWHLDLDVQCACFGSAGPNISPLAGMVRGVILLAVSGGVYSQAFRPPNS